LHGSIVFTGADTVRLVGRLGASLLNGTLMIVARLPGERIEKIAVAYEVAGAHRNTVEAGVDKVAIACSLLVELPETVKVANAGAVDVSGVFVAAI
jgi:hypothetical protein